MKLAEFIDTKRIDIVREWEKFAKSLNVTPEPLSGLILRDHADGILTAIVQDIRSSQTGREQKEKSKGRGLARHLLEIGKIHASVRMENGFNLNQMAAEYRALRACVLNMFGDSDPDHVGITRFNEALDEALIEGISHYMEVTSAYRDQTLGILSHDLRNPLSAIIMSATVLSNAQDIPEKYIKNGFRMLNSANRINRMVLDLLDLTRTRFGDQIPVIFSPFDLSSLCLQVVAEIEGIPFSGEIEFVENGDLRGEWDSDRISQVLSNLLRNAVQHGTNGKSIRLTADGDGDHVVLKVHNNGPVIPEHALSTIFEPMTRGVGKTRNPGLGLGLYIAFQIVVAHGGKLSVVSTEATGTTFTVRLPRHPKKKLDFRTCGTRTRGVH